MCSAVATAEEVTPEQKLEDAFQLALSNVMDGEMANAYKILYGAGSEASSSKVRIPEKFLALKKIGATWALNVFITKMRLHYSNGNLSEASRFAELSVAIIQDEGLSTPKIISRIKRKLQQGIQEMYWLHMKIPSRDIFI